MVPFLPLLKLLEPLLRPVAKKAETSFEFYFDVKCTGCGVCERVCLGQKIRMVDGRPEWQEEVKCLGCFACLNFCPEESIQVKSTWYMKSQTEQNGRYHHPEITAADIARQKEMVAS
jgi:ferredoxin